ncbi:hypothetical protein [Comamonas thiooxydans]|uniref:hypothetical protein n=1 Tax=Comamonas thiooxydans TaxID=363952 RepID=UPI001186E996|nr:hypothetical protein [Comamonas thiooxydans]
MSKASTSNNVQIIVGAIFAIGAGILAISGRQSGELSFYSVMGFIGLVMVVVGFYRRERLLQDYAWYKVNHPKSVDDTGKVKCYSCGSSNVKTKNLMNHTYTRDHHCGNCGTHLFYSSEG